MGFLKLGGMTLSSLFKKPATRRYPAEKREPFARTRGQIALTDVESCLFCGMCQRQCPADAIVVDRKASKWSYWPYKCIACDSCVRTCPKHIIEMLPQRPAVATSATLVHEHVLPADVKAERERAAAEKKAKALAAKQAREQAAADGAAADE